ncbi:MAG: hypothetical protein ABW092_20300 [Candidatus Thiodiazotropha sp.]
MKIALSWILLSALLSIAILFLAPRALPVGDRMAEGIRLNGELQLLEDLMQAETVNRTLVQNKYQELKRDIKPSVVRAQIEGIPKVIIFFSLLGLNTINILVAVGLLIVKSNRMTAGGTPSATAATCFYYFYLALSLTLLTSLLLLILGYGVFSGILILCSLVLLAMAIVKKRD